MKIGILRHAKVIYRKRYFTNNQEFDNVMIAYDTAKPAVVNLKISSDQFPVCYTSHQSRALETAKMIYAGLIIVTDELREVKTAAFFLNNWKVPTILRKAIGRLAWYFNYHKMPETKNDTTARAEIFIQKLLTENKSDVLLITHGFFMHCLQTELRKQGFKGSIPLFPKNATLYIFHRN